MATLTAVKMLRSGKDATAGFTACAGGGDDFKNDAGHTWVHLKNTGTSKVVTFVARKTSVEMGGIGPIPVADVAVTVGATTGEQIVGPFGAEFMDADGKVSMTYDGVTGLTAKVYTTR